MVLHLILPLCGKPARLIPFGSGGPVLLWGGRMRGTFFWKTLLTAPRTAKALSVAFFQLFYTEVDFAPCEARPGAEPSGAFAAHGGSATVKLLLMIKRLVKLFLRFAVSSGGCPAQRQNSVLFRKPSQSLRQGNTHGSIIDNCRIIGKLSYFTRSSVSNKPQ